MNGISPKTLARIGGALYLAIIAIGLFGEAVVRGKVVVAGDAAATAANLKRLEALWRFGIAAELVLLICSTVLTLILYVLLRPVSRNVALLAVFFNLVTIAVEAANDITLIQALLLTDPNQVLTAIRSFSHGFGLALIFFGVECLILGWLIFRSRYFPKTVGVLMAIAGACYLINSFALILSPAFANRLFPWILLPCFVGEASLCGWLLVKGVDTETYNICSSRSQTSSLI